MVFKLSGVEQRGHKAASRSQAIVNNPCVVEESDEQFSFEELIEKHCRAVSVGGLGQPQGFGDPRWVVSADDPRCADARRDHWILDYRANNLGPWYGRL